LIVTAAVRYLTVLATHRSILHYSTRLHDSLLRLRWALSTIARHKEPLMLLIFPAHLKICARKQILIDIGRLHL
jgi:hypothetical protein